METLTYKQACNRSTTGRDFFSLAPTPVDEDCIQAGGDYTDNLKECTALCNQLVRQHGKPPIGTEFFIMENHHDFGTYLELAIFYTEGTEEEESESQLYAANCESLPTLWDEEAIHELENAGYTPFQTKIIKLTA